MTTTAPSPDGSTAASDRLPLPALLALALAGFITILTEALPAGLLPQISAGLDISPTLAGQLVTIYAVGSLLAALPLTALTQRHRRRPLLLTALAGFVVANTITALASDYALTLVARLVAGMSAGLLWTLIAGYASRLVPAHQQGRAMAIAMVGTPLALSLGVPAGTFLGQWMGWRLCFGIMSGLALVLLLWSRTRLPDFAGQPAGQRLGPGQVVTLPGVRAVLFVVLTYVLAHNLLYTYIAPFLAAANMAERTDAVLLAFGLSSLLGIWCTGVLIDHQLRALMLASTALFAVAALMLGLASQHPAMVYGAAILWGLAFGGVPTLLQTALAKAAGDAADVAQSMLVTTWNLGIAGGGVLGGMLLARLGVTAFMPSLLVLLGLAGITVWAARAHGFPSAPRHRARPATTSTPLIIEK